MVKSSAAHKIHGQGHDQLDDSKISFRKERCDFLQDFCKKFFYSILRKEYNREEMKWIFRQNTRNFAFSIAIRFFLYYNKAVSGSVIERETRERMSANETTSCAAR